MSFWVFVALVVLVFYWKRPRAQTSAQDKPAKRGNSPVVTRFSKTVNPDFEIGDTVSFDDPPFTGVVFYSPNKRYHVVTCDPQGKVALIDGKTLRLLVEKIRRPNDAAVANNGNFAFSSWGLPRRKLGGTFYAFGPDGGLLVESKFKTNLWKSFISDDGTFAAVTTLNSHDERDADDVHLLAVFNLGAKKEVWRNSNGWPNPDAIKFVPQDDLLITELRHRGPEGETSLYRYRLSDGEFLDQDTFDAEIKANRETANRQRRDRAKAMKEKT